MNDLEVKIRAYYDLRPADFHVLSSLTLLQRMGPDGACEQVLSLVLQKEFASPAGTLHLEFAGVRKLVLQQPEWSLISVGLIEISLAQELAGQGRHFSVRDSDQEQVIRFECRDFDAHIQ